MCITASESNKCFSKTTIDQLKEVRLQTFSNVQRAFLAKGIAKHINTYLGTLFMPVYKFFTQRCKQECTG